MPLSSHNDSEISADNLHHELSSDGEGRWMDEGPFSSCGNSTTFFLQVFVDSLGNFMANCWYHLGCVGSKREY